jgi:hypothetical protein
MNELHFGDNLEEHRVVMAKGRGGILRDYRIRATNVLWDYCLSNRAEAAVDSRALFGWALPIPQGNASPQGNGGHGHLNCR